MGRVGRGPVGFGPSCPKPGRVDPHSLNGDGGGGLYFY